MAKKKMSELEEIHCSCGGFLYRKGILEAKPYGCVRCPKRYSQEEINGMWLEQFTNNEEEIKNG